MSAEAGRQSGVRDALQRALDLQRSGRLREAGTIYELLLRAQPTQFVALHNLGFVRLQLGEPEVAIALFEQAIAARPSSAEAHNNLGGALQALNRQDDALAPYRRAIALAPRFADAHNNLGVALKAIGRLEAALAAFETAVALDPNRAPFLRNLVDTRTIKHGDPILGRLEDLGRTEQALTRQDRIQLAFARAKAAADVGDHEHAFDCLRLGNRLKRDDTLYDERNTLHLFERLRESFPRKRLGTGLGVRSPRPVFVVGMPRSGTTLVEQILGAHSRVHAAGERTDLEELALTLATPRLPFPGCLAETGADALAHLARVYLDRVGRDAGEAERIVDKMPANARFLGLIHLVFPAARIIHVSRDPVDTCLSCYSILFMGHQPFTYDLGELGRYFRAHTRLMAFWREVLPLGTVHTVRYEQLVADPEGEARRLLAHCGLAWEEGCLTFHGDRRPVKTASAMQVRRPIYANSVGRPRPPQPELDVLLRALGAI